MPKKKKPAIIVDLDGTLADIEVRQKFLTQEKKDWKKFNAGVSTDKLNVWCREIVSRLHGDYKILLVTGREESMRKATVTWLEKYKVPYDELFMRKNRDFRSDTDVKMEIFEAHIKKDFSIFFVIEDRARVVKMWRELGLICLQCDEGDF